LNGISDKAKAADAAKPANASGIHHRHETLIESLPELQHGNHLGKGRKHGLLNALLILRYHLVLLLFEETARETSCCSKFSR
jgi:hypothetical protein